MKEMLQLVPEFRAIWWSLLLAKDFWDVTLVCEDDFEEGGGAQLCDWVPGGKACNTKQYDKASQPFDGTFLLSQDTISD